MAGYSAIAAAGKTLERLLDARLKADVPVSGSTANAVLVRTEDFERSGSNPLITLPALSIFLVRANVNYTMRPTWSAVGSVDDRAHLPLDLHYMLTPWAANAEWEQN